MASIFLDSDEFFPLLAGADIFGRPGGGEGIALVPRVRDVRVDANVERFDLAQASSDITVEVTPAGLTFRTGGETVLSVTSLNQDTQVRFADGNVTFRQIGAATFQAEGANGGTQDIGGSPTALSVALGSAVSTTGDGDFDDEDVGGGTDTGGGGDDGGDGTVTGQVLVDGAAVESIPEAASTLTIGNDASGSVTLSDGERRSFTADGADTVRLGAESGGEGTLTLRDDDTELVTAGTDNTVVVGDAGTGTLAVEDGAELRTLRFEVGRDGTGTATIAGDDSLVVASTQDGLFSSPDDFQAGQVRIGRRAESSGRVEVLNGGALEVRPGRSDNEDTSGPGIALGQALDSAGALVVDGNDSRVAILQESDLEQIGPFLAIGDELGQGDVSIRNEAELVLEGPDPLVRISQGIAEDGSLPPAGGTLDQSTLRVESGATMRVTDTTGNDPAAILIGDTDLADGRLVVTGEDSTLRLNGQGASRVVLGASGPLGGTGEVLVADGGEIQGVTLLDIGRAPLGVGTVTVDGEDSTLALSGAFPDGSAPFIQVGRAGSGTLDITDGGLVTVTGGDASVPGVTVGADAGAQGTLTVQGEDSRLDITGEGGGVSSPRMTIGLAGRGEVEVTNGGEVLNNADADTGFVFVGREPSGDGTLTVSGPDSVFDAGGMLLIGAGFDFTTVAALPDQGGSGRVSVEGEGTLRAETTLIGSNGLLEFGGESTIETDIENQGGTIRLGLGPAQTELDGDLIHEGTLAFDIAGTGSGDFDTLEVDGRVELAGQVTFAFTTDELSAGDTFEVLTADENDGGLVTTGLLSTQVTGLGDAFDVEVFTSNNALTLEIIDSLIV